MGDFGGVFFEMLFFGDVPPPVVSDLDCKLLRGLLLQLSQLLPRPDPLYRRPPE